MNLHVQISWQAQHFVNLHVQSFVNLDAQSWQAQRFANLHAQIFVAGTALPTSTGKLRGTTVADGLGSWSDHGGIMLGIAPL